MNAERATNLPNLSQLKIVSTSANDYGSNVQTPKFGCRIKGVKRGKKYVAYRRKEDNVTEQSFEFTVIDDLGHILVDEETILPIPENFEDHPLIDPNIEGGRGRLFPIILEWKEAWKGKRCSFYYQYTDPVNVVGSGENVFGPLTTFAVYKRTCD